MKRIIVSVMMLCLSCVMGSQEVSAAAVCQKTQWLNGSKCVACPANATCNGQIFKCNKNFAQSGSKCVQVACVKGQWMNGGKCTVCPANATCKDGRTFSCNKNFMQKGNTCISAVCPQGQWMNGTKCTACPANATCKDGKTFSCNKNFAQSGAKCVQAACDKGQWMNGSKCAACPANAYCDGKVFKCNKNFAQSGNKCVPTVCSKGQWMNGTKCTACPANADCKDGKTFTCQTDYVKKGNACAYQNAVAKNCEKYGSHNSFDYIKARAKNCVDCGVQMNSKDEVVYYCYCGTGCSEAKGLSSAVGGEKGIMDKVKKCGDKTIRSKEAHTAAGGAVASAPFTGGASLEAIPQIYKTKYAECVTKEVIKKLHDKLKKAIKKIF